MVAVVYFILVLKTYAIYFNAVNQNINSAGNGEPLFPTGEAILKSPEECKYSIPDFTFYTF